MKTPNSPHYHDKRRIWRIGFAALALTATAGFAQEAAGPMPSDSQSGTWRRLGGQPVQGQGAPMPLPVENIPAQLTIPAGALLSVRMDQTISSDRNQAGDTFTATLERPVVVDGLVVARRGETLVGRVAEAEKAGRVKGTSRLAVELLELSLVDGTQVPLRTQLIGRAGGTSTGTDATVIGTTTGVGAAIGAIAGNGGRNSIGAGPGAAIGAGAGAAAGILGVLLTRGKQTVIYPETILTFRLDQPLTVNTSRAPQAFHSVVPGDFEQAADARRREPRPVMQQRPVYGGWGGWGGPGWGPWGYPYPYYYGPRVGIGVGFGRYYGGRFGRRW